MRSRIQNSRQLSSGIATKPEEIWSTIVATDVQKCFGKDRISEIQIGIYQSFSRRVQRCSQQSAVRTEDSRSSSTRTVHQETGASRHELDSSFGYHSCCMQHKCLRLDGINLRETLATWWSCQRAAVTSDGRISPSLDRDQRSGPP